MSSYVASLAIEQNVTSETMLNALVEREELCRKLSLQAESDVAVPEQQIAGIVSRYFSALSERSETGAWHRVLVRELTESGLLSFHTGNIAESRRLNIPRTAYYWYGGFVAKRVAMMLGCYRYLSVKRNDAAGQRRGLCGGCAQRGGLLLYLPADVPPAESREAELA